MKGGARQHGQGGQRIAHPAVLSTFHDKLPIKIYTKSQRSNGDMFIALLFYMEPFFSFLVLN